MGISLSKFPAPITHRLVGQEGAAFGHQLFDLPVTEAETKVQPGTIADDLCREPVAFIQVGRRWWIHAASMVCQELDK
jgi:hypothetical protein